jgi:uncharacterized protein YdaU (DUF1376 family)
MSRIPHFRLFVDDFLRGTQSMTRAEVGDYIRLLCVIYDNDGKVLLDPYLLRHPLRCNRAVDATRQIQRLIDLGKLSVDRAGYLHNGRADLEIEKRVNYLSVPAANPAVNPAVNPAASRAKNTMFSSRARAGAVPESLYNNSNNSTSARDSALRHRSNDWDLPPTPGPRGQTAFLEQWKETH